MESPIPPSPVSEIEKKLMISRLNELIHLRLFTSQIPSEFTSITVNNGRAYCTVKEVFQAVLTLDGDKLSDPWKILFLDIFAQSSFSGILFKSILV